MGLRETIDGDIKDAMKSGAKDKVSALRMLSAALKNKKIEKRAALTDGEVVDTVRSLFEQRKDSIEQFAGKLFLNKPSLNWVDHPRQTDGKSRQHADGGGIPGAVQAEKSVHPPIADLQGQVLDGLSIPMMWSRINGFDRQVHDPFLPIPQPA